MYVRSTAMRPNNIDIDVNNININHSSVKSWAVRINQCKTCLVNTDRKHPKATTQAFPLQELGIK